MRGAKKLFVQSMMISTSILFLNGINMVLQHLAGNDIALMWYHPLTIVATGVLCSLPTPLLENRDSWGHSAFIIRVSLHFLVLWAVVIGAGYLFNWYESIGDCASVSIIFLIIYVFVWLAGHWLDKQDEKKINRALDAIRDEE